MEMGKNDAFTAKRGKGWESMISGAFGPRSIAELIIPLCMG